MSNQTYIRESAYKLVSLAVLVFIFGAFLGSGSLTSAAPSFHFLGRSWTSDCHRPAMSACIPGCDILGSTIILADCCRGSG